MDFHDILIYFQKVALYDELCFLFEVNTLYSSGAIQFFLFSTSLKFAAPLWVEIVKYILLLVKVYCENSGFNARRWIWSFESSLKNLASLVRFLIYFPVNIHAFLTSLCWKSNSQKVITLTASKSVVRTPENFMHHCKALHCRCLRRVLTAPLSHNMGTKDLQSAELWTVIVEKSF